MLEAAGVISTTTVWLPIESADICHRRVYVELGLSK
jgi:hypothetical protein